MERNYQLFMAWSLLWETLRIFFLFSLDEFVVIEAKQQPPLLTDEENITLRQSIHLLAKAALLKSKKNIYTRTQTDTRYCKQQQKWGNGERRAATRISSGHHNSDFNSMLSQKKKEKSRCIKKGGNDCSPEPSIPPVVDRLKHIGNQKTSCLVFLFVLY